MSCNLVGVIPFGHLEALLVDCLTVGRIFDSKCDRVAPIPAPLPKASVTLLPPQMETSGSGAG
jgi:hypothetical protein